MGANGNDASPRYVACVSYPRSGHHLTAQVLTSYFQGRFKWCEYYTLSERECCKAFPCSRADVSMSKNHDFGIHDRSHRPTPKVPGVPYLVLYRSFLETVVSGYEKRIAYDTGPDTPAEWKKFARQRLAHYRRFVRKWILERDDIEKLTVRYEDLTANPLAAYRSIVSFSLPGEEPDLVRLRRVVDDAVLVVPNSSEGFDHVPHAGIRDRRKIEEFRHFDPAYFASLERRLARELTLLGYPLRYARRPGWRSWFGLRPPGPSHPGP